MEISKDNSFFESRVNAIYIILLVVTLFFYFKGLNERFSLCDVTIYECVVVAAIVVVIAICLFVSSKDNKDVGLFPMLFVVFLVYSLRAPGDLFGTYLWAEDGCNLIQDPIDEGIVSICDTAPGFYWVIPRVIGYLCYKLCLFMNAMAILPMIQGLVTKVVAVIGVGYFISNRFDWVIKERVNRFVISLLVILSIPYYASDVITCDLSVPFILNFTVFLIGLDLLCGPKARCITYLEALFLCAQGLSNAAAPFAAIVALGALIRWLLFRIKTKNYEMSKDLVGIIGTCLVIICSLVQVLRIMDSSRSDNELAVFERIKICFINYVFLPYCSGSSSFVTWLVLFVGCFTIAYLSRISKRIVLFTFAYSFAFLLFCSMVTSPDNVDYVVFGEIEGGGRYILLAYMLSAFLLSLEAYYLIKKEATLKVYGLIILSLMVYMSLVTYSINVIGYEYANVYDESIGLFDVEGDDRLLIQIGPWLPQRVIVPSDISNYSVIEGEIDCRLDPVNYQLGVSDYLSASEPYHNISGTATTYEGTTFEYLLLDCGDGLYQAPLSLGVYPDYSDVSYSELRDNGFVFRVGETNLNSGMLSFVGITEQGELYRWNVVLPNGSEG